MANPWFHSNGPLWVVAVVSGLIVMMLIAVVAPEVFRHEGSAWLVSTLAGVLTAAGIIVWGYSKRHSGEPEEHQSPE